MKSITFFILFLLLSFTSYAQGSYQIINIVDDFGDPTGKLCYTIPFQNGHFSNSATKDARLTGRLNIVLGDTTKSKFKISSIAMGWEFLFTHPPKRKEKPLCLKFPTKSI